MKHCISIAKLFNWSTFMCIYIQHKLFSWWLNYSIGVLTLKMGSIAVLVLYLKLKLNLQVYNIWMRLNYENTKMIGGTQFSINAPIILFFKIFLVDTCPFIGPLILLFRTSGNVSSGFQSQSAHPYSHLTDYSTETVKYFTINKGKQKNIILSGTQNHPFHKKVNKNDVK